MPKALLVFRLPEEETEFRDAADGARAKCVLSSLDEHLRTHIKHAHLTDEVEVAYQELREWLHGECTSHGLDLP